MGLFGLHLPKKVDSVFGAIGRGAVRTAAQINPIDNGRTWQHTTPTNTQSVGKQLYNNQINQKLVNPIVTQGIRASNMIQETPVGHIFAPSKSSQVEQIAKQFKNPDVQAKIRVKGYSDILKSSGIGINDSKATIGRKAVSDIGGTAANFVPVGKTVTVLKAGGMPTVKAGALVATKSGAAGALGSGLATAHDTSNPVEIAKGAGLGFAAGAALPVAGLAAKGAGKKVISLVKTPKAPKAPESVIHLPDKQIYAKLTPEQTSHLSNEVANLKSNAGDIVHLTASTPNLKKNAKEVPLSTITSKSKNAAESINNVPDRIPLEVTNTGTLSGDFQRAITDREANIINYLKKVEKQTGKTGLVDQFYYDSGLQRRSNAIANAQLQTSDNLKVALGGLRGKDKANFDAYTAARNELDNANRGMPTSKPVEELKTIIENLGPKHEARFQALNRFYQEWAKRRLEAGIIDKSTYDQFISNPNYSHIQRDMAELANPKGRGGNSFSLGSTSAKNRRTGSQRDILPSDTTAFTYAQEAQKEIQRNQTASNLIDVLQSMGHARQVSDTTRKNTISRIVDGKTEIWEVPRDIKEIADNISPYQLGVLSRIIAYPQRLLRAGATGLSLPFTAANYVKDQVSSGVYSKNTTATHLPQNIVAGLYQSAKDFGIGTNDPLWEKFQQHLGDTTQYDFLRNAKNSKQLSREIRLGQGGRYLNRGLHPIRTLEDLNQVTEKATRFQNFKGTYEKVLKQTGNEAEATRQATLAAWQNSTDFSRMGNVSQVLNLLIPYFNAGVQGTRLLGRRTTQDPIGTIAKTTAFVGLPLMAATLYNTSDEERKKVYDNISPYEKQNNIIVVLPGAKQQQDGSYTGVIKVPLQPGLSNTVQPIRHGVESFAHANQADAKQMASEFFGAMAGPINTGSPQAAAASLIPQVAKPAVQQVANKDFFTNKTIVPDYIDKAVDSNGNPVPSGKKAYPYTSGSAQIIGNKTDLSPIRIEKFIKDTSGKIGAYSINAIDNVLAKKGIIPKEQIGGVSAKEDLIRRFAVAQGVTNYNKSEGAKYFDNLKTATKGLNPNELAAFTSLHPNKKNFLGDTITQTESVYDPAARLDIYNRYPKVFEADKQLDAKNKIHNPLFSLQSWQVKKVLEKDNLPPGSKDPELSNLYKKDWYSTYQTQRSLFFDQIKKQNESDLAAAKAKGDSKKVASLEKALNNFGGNNPYPVTPPDVQKALDAYSALPKGTGARSAWIKANPKAWAAMQAQFAAVDNWQNNKRLARGLDQTEGDIGKANGYGNSTKTYAYSKKPKSINPADYFKKMSSGPKQNFKRSVRVTKVAAKPRKSVKIAVTVRKAAR